MSGISVKRVLTLLVALSVQAPGWSAEFDGGTGEAEDPYRIATAEQLVSIGSDATLMDKHFVLLNDIDLDPNLPGGRIFDGAVIAGDYARITNSYASGSVHAGSTVRRIGGLVGRSGGPFVNCYASGDVSRKSASPTAYPTMGGLVGDASSSGSIDSCYFLGRNNNLGTQLSAEQMKEQGSFVGWDFAGETANGTDDIWWILEGDDYPRLQWE